MPQMHEEKIKEFNDFRYNGVIKDEKDEKDYQIIIVTLWIDDLNKTYVKLLKELGRIVYKDFDPDKNSNNEDYCREKKGAIADIKDCDIKRKILDYWLDNNDKDYAIRMGRE